MMKKYTGRLESEHTVLICRIAFGSKKRAGSFLGELEVKTKSGIT